MNDSEAKTNWNPKRSKLLSLSAKHGLWIALVVICILASLLAWSVLFRAYAKCHQEPMCISKDCVTVAANILARIDDSVDPCEDFYQFACGNYMKINAVPDDFYAKNLLQEMQEEMFVEMKSYLESSTNDDHLIQQIKNLYTSCINETEDDLISSVSVEALFSLIIELIGTEWPILSTEEEYTSAEMPLEHKLALISLYQVQPFFQIYVTSNRNSSSYALHILPGTTIMELYHFGISKQIDNQTESHIDAYLDFQKLILKYFCQFKSGGEENKNKEKIDRDLQLMFMFEVDLVNISKEVDGTNETEHAELEEQSLFINMTVEEMQKEFPSFDWKVFFEHISSEANVTITNALIHSKEYFRSLLNLLETHSSETINNYLGWTIIIKYLPYLADEFRRLSSEFQDKVLVTEIDGGESNTGFKYYQSKWKQCVFIACDGLKIPAISLYFKHQKQNIEIMSHKLDKLISEIKQSFLAIIDQQTWIESNEVKSILKKRIKSIKSKLGVPEHILNQTLISQMYSELEIDPGMELITNIFKINRHEVILEVRKLNQQINSSDDWIFQPLDANAFYDSMVNHIIIPVGIIRKPLVYLDIPKYLELAFFGIVIGHEIAHSIDMSSRKFISEKYPQFANSTFAEQYKKKAQCFVEMYSNYSIKEIGRNLNGSNTLDENICDFASFQQVYSLYQTLNYSDKIALPGLSHFTIDQVFYLQYAQLWCESTSREGHYKSLQDIHSPGKFRANAVLMNSADFADAFHCKEGAKMRSTSKCDLWHVNL